MNYAISKYRFADTRLWYYDPDGLQRQRVLANLLSEDSLNKFPLIITDLKNNAECSHRHLYTPERGITIIQLANKQIEPTNDDFWDDFYNPQRDYLIVVIVSNEDNTCFYVEENQHVFGSTEEVIKMLIKSINKGLSNKWLRIEQEGEIITSKDNLAVVCVSAYVTAMLRQIMKERKTKQELTPPPKKKKSKNKKYEDYILIENKTGALKLAHELTDGYTSAQHVMGVQKAMRDAKVLSKNPPVPHDIFKDEFESGEGRSRTSYSECLGRYSYIYDNNDMYTMFFSKFMDLIEKEKSNRSVSH